jgi:hypothetical protein
MPWRLDLAGWYDQRMVRLVLRVLIALAVVWLAFTASRTLTTIGLIWEFRRQRLAVVYADELINQLAPVFCFVFALIAAYIIDRLWNPKLPSASAAKS